MPLAALLGAAFMVASTLHMPVGVGSVHLILNGLAGLLLGWAVFPLFFVALLLQAALFSFGGFTVLGANLLIMAALRCSAICCWRRRCGASPAGVGCCWWVPAAV
ncbi:energy-coupling factor ABC transporter permease [Halopseudomonas pachastrellae]|nr:energy-coupling factor ABC transporter permease [Halopseudomonas pachastrellae]